MASAVTWHSTKRTQAWECSSMGILKHGNTWAWEHSSVGILEHGNTRVWEYSSMGILKCGNTQVFPHRYDNYIFAISTKHSSWWRRPHLRSFRVQHHKDQAPASVEEASLLYIAIHSQVPVSKLFQHIILETSNLPLAGFESQSVCFHHVYCWSLITKLDLFLHQASIGRSRVHGSYSTDTRQCTNQDQCCQP